MTVVSVLYFNETSGAMVADEQSSTTIRKVDVATKIHPITIPDFDQNGAQSPRPIHVLMGGTGTSDVLNAITIKALRYGRTQQREYTSKEDVAKMVGQVMGQVRREFTHNYLMSTYGLSEADFQIARRTMPDGSIHGLTPQLLTEYDQITKNPSGPLGFVMNNEFLIFGADKEGAQIYRVLMNLLTPVPVARQYESVGSGSDMAELELATFFESRPREERQNIGRVTGIQILLQATDAANKRNQGVGGTPMIGIIDDGKMIFPSGNSSTLAMEVTYGQKHGYLSQEFANEALESLMFKAEPYDTVEKEMWKATSDAERFSRALRGYKV